MTAFGKTFKPVFKTELNALSNSSMTENYIRRLVAYYVEFRKIIYGLHIHKYGRHTYQLKNVSKLWEEIYN